VIAIVGATLIDGNGGDPLPDSVVLVDGETVAALGPQAEVPVPEGCERIDASGRFLTPGLIDTNVHLAPFYYPEELVLYRGRYEEVGLETAQLMLRTGVTTVRDTYGPLRETLAVRDAIRDGRAVGPRVLVGGNIVGWGGPLTLTFDPNPYIWGPNDVKTSYLMERIQDEFTQGTGEELVDMDVAELREAIDAYLDRGIDLLKFGGTTHMSSPSLITFSPRAQEAIVELAHARGLPVDVHSTSPEGLRISILAGIDVVQHPELHWTSVPLPDELIELHASSGVVCSMNVPYWTGRVWTEYTAEREAQLAAEPDLGRELTTTERRKVHVREHRWIWRQNAVKLLAAGITVSTASDSCALTAPELRRGTETYLQTFMHAPGEGTVRAVEGLVEMGFTPLQAITAGTKHGALASHALERYGTIEAGKSADLLLLDADPLADISNIRRLSLVMARGTVVDREALPVQPVYSRDPSVFE
jgi:imidazolonepropionase-like amidohydrolase